MWVANRSADEGSNILEQSPFRPLNTYGRFWGSLLPLKRMHLPINTGSHIGGLECCSYLLKHETSLSVSPTSATKFVKFTLRSPPCWSSWPPNFLLWYSKILLWRKYILLKVKSTLVQALRLCTGRTVHRGSRGIALLFYDHVTRRKWGVSVTPRPLFTPGKIRYPFYRKLGGPQGRSGQVRKNSPPQGFDPWTVQPVTSRYTDWATRSTHFTKLMLFWKLH